VCGAEGNPLDLSAHSPAACLSRNLLLDQSIAGFDPSATWAMVLESLRVLLQDYSFWRPILLKIQ
jgi:hypothetical protein